MDAVFAFWGVDCQFGGNFGVLKPGHFDVQERQMPCLVFPKYQVSKAAIIKVSHRVRTMLFQYKLTSVKTIA